MKIRVVSFTARGDALAQKLPGDHTVGHGRPGFSLGDWTREAFSQADGLIFVGAAGIAVRAIAPFLQDKSHDPAVVVVDENGRFAIPILSGHLGGANELARDIAAITGGTAVLTTATDGRGLFAVDSWAKRQGCCIANPEKIKAVSAKLLAGGTVTVGAEVEISGTPPAGVALAQGESWDVWVGACARGDALHIVPPCFVLGVGCKKGTPSEAFETALPVHPLAVCGAASIDLKAREPGLLAFCEKHGWKLQTFTAGELAAVPGDFSASPFVAQVTGVDNVCERAAVLASGGKLLYPKQAQGGVTMALAQKDFTMDWRW